MKEISEEAPKDLFFFDQNKKETIDSLETFLEQNSFFLQIDNRICFVCGKRFLGEGIVCNKCYIDLYKNYNITSEKILVQMNIHSEIKENEDITRFYLGALLSEYLR